MNIMQVNYIKHHGVLGMHWGIRRYQPYPSGYHGDGKMIGKAALKATKGEKKAGKAARKIGEPDNLKRTRNFSRTGAIVGGPIGALAGGKISSLVNRRHPEGDLPHYKKIHDMENPGKKATAEQKQLASDLKTYKAKLITESKPKAILKNINIFTDQELKMALHNISLDRNLAKWHDRQGNWLVDIEHTEKLIADIEKSKQWVDLNSISYQQMDKALRMIVSKEKAQGSRSGYIYDSKTGMYKKA